MTDGGGDGLKALADFWSAQGVAMLEAQQTMARSLFGSGSPPEPGQPDLSKAADAMTRLWSVAADLSTEMASRLPQAIATTPANGWAVPA